MRKRLYTFELGLGRVPSEEDIRPHYDEYDALYDAGCDDMTFASVDGVAHAGVDREAPSFIEAAVTAIGDIESVGDLRVLSIVVDPELTIQEIAERAGVTREAVRLATKEPAFPAPVITTPRHRFWRWSEVAPRFRVDDPILAEAAPVARVLNAWLTLRAALPSIAPDMAAVRAALEAAA